MGSIMELDEGQLEFVNTEGHHEGKRYVLVLIDRADGSVEMDYESEILRRFKEHKDENFIARLCEVCNEEFGFFGNDKHKNICKACALKE